MTEKEAIEYLRNTPLMRFEDGSGVHSGLGDAMRMAVQALEEIQKYRAIGLSPELIEAMQGHNIALINQVEEAREKAIDEILVVIKEVYHNFGGYDLEYMTKYGNKTEEQQHQSYSTLMLYEIAGEFDDLIDRIAEIKGE